MRTYCTYFDRNYFVKGLAMIRSLQRHEARPFQLYVICHDEITRTLLDALAISEVITVPFHAIEQGDAALLATREDRTPVEYYWTATPTVMLRLLEAFPAIDVLTYVDADLYFFQSPDPVFEALGDNSVLIQPHRFAPELAHLEAESGTYNVGLMAFRNDERGKEVLSWWRERCIEWCYSRVEDGKMGDQAYLNDWTERFDGIAVLDHVGAGTAPWNVSQYAVTGGNADVQIDGEPLVFYHYHALKAINSRLVIPAIHIAYRLSEPVLRHCYVPYVRALSEAVEEIHAVSPGFSFGMLDVEAMQPGQVLLFDPDMSQALEEMGHEGPTLKVGGTWHALSAAQLLEHASLMKLSVDTARAESRTPATAARANPIAAPAPTEVTAPLPAAYRVTAMVSTYDAADHLEGCLQDLVEQSLFAEGALEIVVVDAASTQDERTIVERFAKQHGHIVYVRTSARESIYQSWNRAIRLSSAPYLTNANTDDRHRRDAYERLADHLDAHRDVSLVYADSLITPVANDTFAKTEAPLRFGWPEYSYDELERRCFMGPHPMWRRTLHDTYGLFDTQYRSAGDFEFWLRAGARETFARYPDVLGLYYVNPAGVQNSSGVAVQEHQQILERYGIVQRGVQPASTPRVPVYDAERTALRAAGGYPNTPQDIQLDGSIKAWIAKFNEAVSAERSEDADRVAAEAVEACPNEPYAWVMRAIGLRLVGRHSDAMDAVARSLRIVETPHALVELMQLGMVTGSHGEAIQVATHLRQRYPEWVDDASRLMGRAA